MQVASFSVDSEGICSINGNRVPVPQVSLERVISKGASGVVFRGRHKYLERDVAVKFWLKLRPRDNRDKFQQGVAEARKADRVSPTRAVLRLFDAGELRGYFYAVMEYYQSITLREWLEHYKPNLGVRRELAVAILDEIVALANMDINHGDLHTSNILVAVPEDTNRYVDFRIIDFGTSLFTAEQTFSVKRHWKLVTETMERLLFPYTCKKFIKTPFPAYGKPRAIGRWYYSLIEKIAPLLIECGASWLKDPLKADNVSVDPDELMVVRSFISDKKIELTEASLGTGPAYRDYLRDDLKPADDVYYRQPKPDFSEARKEYRSND